MYFSKFRRRTIPAGDSSSKWEGSNEVVNLDDEWIGYICVGIVIEPLLISGISSTPFAIFKINVRKKEKGRVKKVNNSR